MTVVLLANVGLRDVRLNGEAVQAARTRGQELLESLDRNLPHLDLPVLYPLVDFVLRSRSEIEVVLYGTDQPEGTPPRYRDNDTVYLAGLAARLLEKRYSRRIKGCRAKPVSANPSLYDDMLSVFRAELSPSQRWTGRVEECYACADGGTPAANTGLMLAAIERFGERCSTLYLPDGQQHPVRMAVGDQIRRSVARHLAIDRLSDLSFGAAVPLMENAGAARWMIGVGRHAIARYHFDFDAASEQLDEAVRASGDDWRARSRCREIGHNLPELRDHRLPALICELYHNAAMAYRRGEFAAFLGLVFRFQEGTLRHIVEEGYPGISTETDDKRSRKRFEQYIEDDPGLRDYLRAQTVNGSRLQLDEGASRPVLSAMARYLLREEGSSVETQRREGYRAALEFLQRLDRLSALRNKSVIAHGFEGVSRERILSDYRYDAEERKPLADMKAALEALGMPPGDSPFEATAALLVEALGRE